MQRERERQGEKALDYFQNSSSSGGDVGGNCTQLHRYFLKQERAHRLSKDYFQWGQKASNRPQHRWVGTTCTQRARANSVKPFRVKLEASYVLTVPILIFAIKVLPQFADPSYLQVQQAITTNLHQYWSPATAQKAERSFYFLSLSLSLSLFLSFSLSFAHSLNPSSGLSLSLPHSLRLSKASQSSG